MQTYKYPIECGPSLKLSPNLESRKPSQPNFCLASCAGSRYLLAPKFPATPAFPRAPPPPPVPLIIPPRHSVVHSPLRSLNPSRVHRRSPQPLPLPSAFLFAGGMVSARPLPPRPPPALAAPQDLISSCRGRVALSSCRMTRRTTRPRRRGPPGSAPTGCRPTPPAAAPPTRPPTPTTMARRRSTLTCSPMTTTPPLQLPPTRTRRGRTSSTTTTSSKPTRI